MATETLDRDARAMQAFEKAMEKESHGLMSDAVRFYREAFKLNEQIDLIYRKHKVPSNVEKLQNEHGKNFSRKVDENVVRAINVDELLASFEHEEPQSPDPANPDHHGPNQMTITFANMSLEEQRRPASPLLRLPKEIWVSVLSLLLQQDPESWFRFGITCKKNAYLAFHTSDIWRQLCYHVYPKQQWEENEGFLGHELPIPIDPVDVLPQYGSWKQMVHQRPFIKFLGCYISVVNYYSEGGRTELSTNWTNPVRTVTYYRYLRFYPNGSCVMALTRMEPVQVVHQMSRNNELRRLLVNSESKDLRSVNPADEPHKIFHGRWTISTDARVHVQVAQGSVPYYHFHYHFRIKNLGGVSKHCKLAWDRFYAVWKHQPGYEDREGEIVDFSLKNEKDFKFSRVRSYTEDN